MFRLTELAPNRWRLSMLAQDGSEADRQDFTVGIAPDNAPPGQYAGHFAEAFRTALVVMKNRHLWR